jgi:hypothetical protein
MRWKHPTAEKVAAGAHSKAVARGKTRNKTPHAPRKPRSAKRAGLVVGRSRHEQVEIDLPDGGTICVTVLQCSPTRAKLHIAARPEIGIRRSELPKRPVESLRVERPVERTTQDAA